MKKTDSNDFSEFKKWHEKNPYIFHWTVKDGEVEIIHIYANMDDEKQAQRLARALRYRGVSARTNLRHLIVDRCNFGKFKQALDAIKIDWDDFKEKVSMLYFDGDKHITDEEVKEESFYIL